jgi:urea transport system substrate-binding protein
MSLRKSALPVVILAIVLTLIAGLAFKRWLAPAKPPIRIGLLHSLTGTMAVSERPLIDAERLAVEEINAHGGLLGRPVEMVMVDGQSNWDVFAREADRLITQEHVDALFACWTSACRKAVKPVVERHNHLMFYPVQYEGLEQSPNILYTGSAPNQQIVPGTRWAIDSFGKRVYLIGSDYVFPRTANLMIRDLVASGDGQVLGERYLPLGSRDMAEVVADIQRLKPAVVLNTLNGDSNAAFFDALIKADLSATPLVSFSVAEPEMAAWGGGRLSRHYGVWSYFQSLPRVQNQRFVAAFKKRYGADRVTSDPIEAAYVGVKLWAQAVLDASSAEPARVNPALLRESLDGPSEVEAVDTATRHLWKMVRVGKVRPDGQFDQVFASSKPLRPAPWPFYRSKQEWQAMVENKRP